MHPGSVGGEKGQGDGQELFAEGSRELRSLQLHHGSERAGGGPAGRAGQRPKGDQGTGGRGSVAHTGSRGNDEEP